MPKRKQNTPKSPPGQSTKAHVDKPPRTIEPHMDGPDGGRPEVGQFTDQGSPGLQKR
ncbi:MAG: hypothetical protein U0531_19010 [Dehalococcoidia bacterium]